MFKFISLSKSEEHLL